MLPNAKDSDVTTILQKISLPERLQIEPVGRWFEAYSERLLNKHATSQRSLSSSSSEESEDDFPLDDEEISEALLLGLDPKEWKNQDHYAVLGLKTYRYKASEDHIKHAYKKKVLRHHPDKRKARGLTVSDGEDDYFTCITRAYEILGNLTKRRSYDSVDPEFDESIPSNNQNSKDKFYEVFAPVFESNARWSNKKSRVSQQLGDETSTFDYVNDFYAFWYDFDSWREYSYLDEEEKEKGENRDERRWIEKQNRAERQKRKKQEVSRIRQLVDNAYALDPRIQKFKDEEKAKKLALKKAKQDASRQKAEEEEKIIRDALEEGKRKKEKEAEEVKKQATALRKEREAQKKALNKEKELLRTSMKEFDYFGTNESERVDHMLEVEKMAEMLSILSLQSLNEVLSTGDKVKGKEAFLQHMKEMNEKVEKEKMEQVMSMKKTSGGDGDKKKKAWSDAELQCLIKAVNLFAAGTHDRWEVIAKFIAQHVEGSDKVAKDVLAKAKKLQKNDFALKEDAQKKAYEHFVKDTKSATCRDAPSERLETIVDQQLRETGSNQSPWTCEEQKLLEQALKTYNASTPERWEKISEAVKSRSKKDCIKRYKEICEIVKAKKAAVEAAAKEKRQ